MTATATSAIDHHHCLHHHHCSHHHCHHHHRTRQYDVQSPVAGELASALRYTNFTVAALASTLSLCIYASICFFLKCDTFCRCMGVLCNKVGSAMCATTPLFYNRFNPLSDALKKVSPCCETAGTGAGVHVLLVSRHQLKTTARFGFADVFCVGLQKFSWRQQRPSGMKCAVHHQQHKTS